MSLSRRDDLKLWGILLVGSIGLGACAPVGSAPIDPYALPEANIRLSNSEVPNSEIAGFVQMSPQVQTALNYAPGDYVQPVLPIDANGRLVISPFNPPERISSNILAYKEELIAATTQNNLGLTFPANDISQTIYVNAYGQNFVFKPGENDGIWIRVVQGRDNKLYSVIELPDGRYIYTDKLGHGHLPTNLRNTSAHYIARHSSDISLASEDFKPIVSELPFISERIFGEMEIGKTAKYNGFSFIPDTRFDIGTGRVCFICDITGPDGLYWGTTMLSKQMTNPPHYYGFIPDFPIASRSNRPDVTKFAAYLYLLETALVTKEKGKSVNAMDMRTGTRLQFNELFDLLSRKINEMPDILDFMKSRGAIRTIQSITPGFVDLLSLRVKHLMQLTDATGLDGVEYWEQIVSYALFMNILGADILSENNLPDSAYGELDISKLRGKNINEGILPIVKKFGNLSLPAYSVENPDFIYNLELSSEGSINLQMESNLGGTNFFVGHGRDLQEIRSSISQLEFSENDIYTMPILMIPVDMLPTQQEFLKHVSNIEHGVNGINNWDMTNICLTYNEEPFANNVVHRIYAGHFITPDGQEKFMHIILKIDISRTL